jgi:hypothetical protein
VGQKNWIRSRAFLAATLATVFPLGAYAQCSGEHISSYVRSGAAPDQLRAPCGQETQAQAATTCITRGAPVKWPRWRPRAVHASATLSKVPFPGLLAEAKLVLGSLWATFCTIGALSHSTS